MEYKEIYDELYTVLWGDEIAKTEVEGLKGVDRGYLIELYNPFHTHLYKIIQDKHDRVSRIFKKFADKLYSETKDEYVIKLLSQACMYVGDIHFLTDIMEICGTKDDPGLMFDEFKKEEAVEPKPEPRCCLVKRTKDESGKIEEEKKYYRFFEEAKDDFDKEVAEYRKWHLYPDALELAQDDVALFQTPYFYFTLEIVKCDK